MNQDKRDAVRHDNRWPVLPVPQAVKEPVATLHPDTKRETELVRLRLKRPLTGAEALELWEVARRNDARQFLADVAHDQATEARAFPRNPNIHDD